MRLHAGIAARPDAAPCRVLVAGFGFPGRRDLDFGERFVRLAESLEWPDGVVVEDLSCSAHLVLHRLQELRPAKMILVGATTRGVDPPGTVRRYRVDRPASSAEEVHAHLTDSIGGTVDLHGTLALVGHFGGLPSDTVVVEVEAADSSFGVGFSEELAAAIDPLLEAVREELGDAEGDHMLEPVGGANDAQPAGYPTSTSPGRAPGGATRLAAPPGIDQLFQYAQAHAQVRAMEALAARPPVHAGVALAARFLPAGTGLGFSGDWYDVIPLTERSIGLVIADVSAGSRVDACMVTAQLKMAVRALALGQGDRPASVVAHLDDLVASTGVGTGSTLAYITVDTVDGTMRLAGAGHCPPVLLGADGRASLVEDGRGASLGHSVARVTDAAVELEAGATLLLFTDGLVGAAGHPPAQGLAALRRAAESGPPSLEGLCDHVVQSALAPLGPTGDDDVSLLAIRFLGT